MQRDPNTGEIIDFREVPIQGAGNTAKNSMSLTRTPAPPSEATWGSISNFPFWPGGFPEVVTDLPEETSKFNPDGNQCIVNFLNITNKFLIVELLTIPPGFTRGIVFEDDGCTIKTDCDGVLMPQKIPKSNNVVNLMDILDQHQDYLGNKGLRI